jgi:carbonic anhydrase
LKEELKMNATHRIQRFALAVICLFGAIFVAAFGDMAPSADEVIAMLKKGNERFAGGNPTYPHEGAARRAEVSPSQHPLATIISCSDSRVPPEILFDEGIGDLFIVRVIGNIGGADETGSAEYGVEHLGTQLLVVLGHTSCGAVTAAVTGLMVEGSIPPLLAHIKPAVQTAHKEHPELSGNDLVPEAVRTNVFHSIQELFTRSEIIRARTQSGKLKAVGAIYDIKSGRVNWLGEHPQQAIFLKRGRTTTPARPATRHKI